MDRATRTLRKRILEDLYAQGLSLNGHRGVLPPPNDPEDYRLVQQRAKQEQLAKQRPFLRKAFDEVKLFSRDGVDIDPARIQLELRKVLPGSLEEHLFRWWNLVWWSLPYQKTYGRQLRFLLWDRTHDAPFGLIGLHSAPLKLAVRDDALGISKQGRDWWVNMSLSAQRVGALPPYNELLGGKMAALALTANELRMAYKEQYEGRVSIIKGRVLPADLMFVTTTGAFGRASIYNRLTHRGKPVAQFVGSRRAADRSTSLISCSRMS